MRVQAETVSPLRKSPFQREPLANLPKAQHTVGTLRTTIPWSQVPSISSILQYTPNIPQNGRQYFFCTLYIQMELLHPLRSQSLSPKLTTRFQNQGHELWTPNSRALLTKTAK